MIYVRIWLYDARSSPVAAAAAAAKRTRSSPENAAAVTSRLHHQHNTLNRVDTTVEVRHCEIRNKVRIMQVQTDANPNFHH